MTVNNCFQGFASSIHRGAYAVQQKICNLSSTESKINSLVVLGHLLQATAVISGVASLAFAFIMTPLALVGLVPSLIMSVFGAVIINSPNEVLDAVMLGPPFIPGQPIGLINSGSNCWLNSCMQMLINCPSLSQKMQRIPMLATFQRRYEMERQACQKIARNLDVQGLREYFSRQTGGQISPRHVQQDPAELFEYLFQGQNAIHALYQQIDNGPSIVRREPMIQINLSRQPQLSLQELFNQYFDHRIHNGQRMRLSFERAPEDLLIQAQRFTQVRDLASGNNRFEKNCNPIDAIPQLSLAPEGTRSGVGAQYNCDAFTVHYGASINCGHHVAYVKQGDMWWYCSDVSLRPVSMHDALQAMKHGCIFHYTKAI